MFGKMDYRNIDCMEGMKEYSDNYFELAIVDPPYGIKINKQSLGEGGGVYRGKKTYKRGNWDNKVPDKEYFDELMRVSKNQIIWGGNYYNLGKTTCYLVWDKNNGGSDFADAELAWTSFSSPVRLFKYTWSGFIQGNMKEKEYRIHPTQKPAALYKWLLQNYAKEGYKILDTHVGSGSSIIACLDLGFDVTGFELDKEYYDKSMKRITDFTDQGKLF